MDFHCELIQNYLKAKLQNKIVAKRQHQKSISNSIYRYYGFHIKEYGHYKIKK